MVSAASDLVSPLMDFLKGFFLQLTKLIRVGSGPKLAATESF